MSSFTLRLLGPPCLFAEDAGGAPVPLGSKQLALLAYLVLEPGVHTRDELATLLWGESPGSDARASLRQALKHLRDALGPALEAGRTSVRLAAPVDCDVLAFRRAAAEDRATAAQFDITHVLTGLCARHAPSFDEWVERTRAELVREYVDALAALGREAIDGHAWSQAVGAAERWLAVDPLSSGAARLAVEASYLAGDRRAALARFADFRDRLRQETGEAPDRSLLALVRRVEADPDDSREISRLSGPEREVDLPTLDAPLVEREPEWRRLVTAWRAVDDELGGIVLIEGETGLGKTRLADEFVRWIIAGGGIALHGRGYGEGAGVPYGSLADVLHEAALHPAIGGTDPDWLAEVSRLAPELRQRFPGLPAASPPGDPMHSGRLYEAVAQVLLSLSAERRVVIVVDDLQWCDEESCGLLLFLTRRLERAPVLWLGIATLGELERDAAAARLCRVWRTRPQATAVTLEALSPEGVWSLIRSLGGLQDTPRARAFARRLHDVTRGNPFYIQELLKTFFAQHVIRSDGDGGVWTLPAEDPLAGSFDVPMSRSVNDAIAERVDRLPGPAHDVLVTVAVAEIGCGTELLSQVHGISRLHAASLGDALLDRRLLVEGPNGYRCAHPIIGRVVRDRLSPSRRREVHRALALALEILSLATGSDALAGEIARHAEQGGETALAYRAALAASRAASERFSHREALGWVDRAAASARSPDETEEVNRLTALLLDTPASAVPVRR